MFNFLHSEKDRSRVAERRVKARTTGRVSTLVDKASIYAHNNTSTNGSRLKEEINKLKRGTQGRQSSSPVRPWMTRHLIQEGGTTQCQAPD
jgi:hypothetical protein